MIAFPLTEFSGRILCSNIGEKLVLNVLRFCVCKCHGDKWDVLK